MSQEEIFEQLKKIIAVTFEIEESKISLDSNIVTDLNLDSIDAIEMLSSMQRNLNCRLSPNDFKSVKTVGDIVDVIHKHITQ